MKNTAPPKTAITLESIVLVMQVEDQSLVEAVESAEEWVVLKRLVSLSVNRRGLHVGRGASGDPSFSVVGA